MTNFIFKIKNIAATLFVALILIFTVFVSNQMVFAGDSGYQSGTLAYKHNNFGRPSEDELERQEQQFQAAQIRNGGGGGANQTPTAGSLSGGDSSARSIVSYFASLFLLAGGIWLLVSLLGEGLRKKFARRRTRAGRILDFAFKPSFALSAFAFLFAAVIVGSALTAPQISSAQTEYDGDESASFKTAALDSPSVANQSVFKSGQQIGGTGGTTQIGAPVYDGLGNYFVRGAFSGTLTLGNTTLTATQGLDLFFAKFDQNENLLWVRHGSGITNAPHEDLAVEGATAMAFNGTDLYIAGSFVKTLTLPGGANQSVTLNDNGAPGYNYELFVAKYDANGNLQWAKGGNSGSPKNQNNLELGQNTINRILFDGNGSPYLAGIISGNNFLGTPLSNFTCNTDLPCQINGRSDVLLAYLNPNDGTPTGVKVIGGAGDDNALDMAVDNVSGSAGPQFYLVGTTDSPQIRFQATTGGGTYTNNNSSGNTFILKFEGFNLFSARDGVWVKFINNGNLVGIKQIVTDPVNGVPYVAGFYKGTLTSALSQPITNSRTGSDEASLDGFVSEISRDDGSFIRLAGLGGAADGLTIRPGGNIYAIGSIYGTRTFTNGAMFPQTTTLDAFDGNDLFIAEINKFSFEFASLKAVAGTGVQGKVAVADPTSADGSTRNGYTPLAVTLDGMGQIAVSGDFSGTLSLDCQTLKTPPASRHAYIARILNFNETTSCRVWTNEDPNNRNWNEPNNWNGGILPSSGDSVYVPYRKNAFYNPIYNPTDNVTLGGVSIADNQTLILQQNLSISQRLDLLGGDIDAGTNQVNLGAFLDAYSISGGRIIGKTQKLFFGTGDFTFPVGTMNGYSPVTLSNYNAGKGGTFAVTANEGTYPNAADGLPANRAGRWWNLSNGGLASADVTFKYLPGDITAGTESDYRAFRIPTGGGTAAQVSSTINTTAKTVFVPNVSQFSDWTLAQLAPSAAMVEIGGKVTTPNGYGISYAAVVISDDNGNSQITRTNSFGYFRFEEVETGKIYTLSVRHRRYIFAPQIVNIFNAVENLQIISGK